MQKSNIEPTILVIFGVTGDLAKRKILPALYNLQERGMLPEDFHLVGFARRDWSADEFKQNISEVLRTSPNFKAEVLEKLFKNACYIQGDFGISADYRKLREYLDEIEEKAGHHIGRIFHLATAPSSYPDIFKELGEGGLTHCCQIEKIRLMIEKPFGHDADSAEALNELLLKYFTEDQIYRVDHYLGKEPVQNILAVRFANAIFADLWNNRHIDNVQIVAAEQIGIEGRGAYYEEAGVLLDIVQNHILQLIALIAMEDPESMQAEEIRDKKYEILKKVSFSTRPGEIIRGQYRGYTDEKNVSADSQTETFIALKGSINDPFWQGVPFYIRAGKNLERKYTEINIEFKQPLMHFMGQSEHPLSADILTIRIEPDEMISLRLMIKKPTFEMALVPVLMDFCYNTKYQDEIPDAYEKIIHEALLGNRVLFVRSDAVVQQWKIIDQVKAVLNSVPLIIYQPGSRGPEEQDSLVHFLSTKS